MTLLNCWLIAIIFDLGILLWYFGRTNRILKKYIFLITNETGTYKKDTSTCLSHGDYEKESKSDISKLRNAIKMIGIPLSEIPELRDEDSKYRLIKICKEIVYFKNHLLSEIEEVSI